jgi:hypothetical protein
MHKEKEVENRERLVNEQKIEFVYKTEQLNLKVKNQLVWPLNQLQNES